MLFEGLDRLKRDAALSTIILMLLGMIFLVLPDSILPSFGALIGFALLVVSVVSIFDFLASKKVLMNYINLSIGLLGGLLGICFLVLQGFFMGFLMWLISFFPILGGLYGIYHALMFARRVRKKGWWILIVLSLFLVVFGVFVFWNPWMNSVTGAMRVMGGTMLYSSIVSGLRLIWLWPIRKADRG